MSKAALTLILLVTNQCNFNCSYCYASKVIKNSKNYEVIQPETLKNLFEQISVSSLKEVYFNWHGGEPLIAGLTSFKEFINLEKKVFKNNNDIIVHNCIQSNGSLIDENWTSFLQEHNIPIGISIDGPMRIQDEQRPTLDGSPSYGRTLNGIKLSKEADINSGVLSVLTNENIHHGIDILNHAKINSFNIDFLPCFSIDSEMRIIPELTLKPDLFGDFLINGFIWWIEQDDPSFDIRFFSETVRTMLGGEPTICSLRNGCSDFITVSPNGDLFPCDFFAGLPKMKIGNICEDKLEDVLTSRKYENIMMNLQKRSDYCKDCDYFYVCGGGCSYQTVFSPTKHFYFCDSRKRFFDFVADWLY